MRKLNILTAIFFLFSISVFAQNKPDYSGEWVLDKSKMSSGANINVESITIKAAQTANDITVDVTTTFPAQADESTDNGDGSQSKRVRRPVLDGKNVYSLDGKESVVEIDSPVGKLPLKLQGDLASDGKLSLKAVRTIKTPNGEIAVTIQELWELADEGKTLKVTREITAPNGSNKTQMAFTKK